MVLHGEVWCGGVSVWAVVMDKQDGGAGNGGVDKRVGKIVRGKVRVCETKKMQISGNLKFHSVSPSRMQCTHILEHRFYNCRLLAE